MFKYISLSLLGMLIFSGCTIHKTISMEDENQLTYSSDEGILFDRLKMISDGKADNKNSAYDTIKKDMLKTNPIYANDKIDKAIVENKRDDEISSKPMFLEPLFAKIEIMPYNTEDELYHEQQSVWVQVKSGEIVLKANKDNKTVDNFSTVLSK